MSNKLIGTKLSRQRIQRIYHLPAFCYLFILAIRFRSYEPIRHR